MRIALITIHHFSFWFAQCKTRLDNDVLNNPASHLQYFQWNQKDANKNVTVAYRLSVHKSKVKKHLTVEVYVKQTINQPVQNETTHNQKHGTSIQQ